MRCHPETRAYEALRTLQGKIYRDIRRCLKRSIARRLYRVMEAAARQHPAFRPLGRHRSVQRPPPAAVLPQGHRPVTLDSRGDRNRRSRPPYPPEENAGLEDPGRSLQRAPTVTTTSRRHSYPGGKSPGELVRCLQAAPASADPIAERVLESIVRSSLAQIGLLNAEITGLERELTDTLAKHPGLLPPLNPVNLRPIVMANGWPRSVPCPRSGTVRDPYDNALAEPLTATTRPNCSAVPPASDRPGRPLTTSSSPPSAGSTGTTTTACTATSTTSHKQTSRRRSTLRNGPTSP